MYDNMDISLVKIQSISCSKFAFFQIAAIYKEYNYAILLYTCLFIFF